jgi:hypothetical protein
VPQATASSSPDDAWKTVKTIVVSGARLWSLQCVREGQSECRIWLQREIPWQFWKLFVEYLQEQNSVHEEKMCVINDDHGYGAGKELMKWMSYEGAVRVWPGFPTSEAHWVDSVTGEGYVDCGHQIYWIVAKSTWPQAFSGRNSTTTDDIIEAFFAYAWKCRSKGITQPPHILRFVDVLNNFCFAMWLQSMMDVD